MRTTLDIADDVLFAIKERAKRDRRTLGEVLSEVARAGLNGLGLNSAPNSPESFFGFQPLPPRGHVISNELIDQLREETGD